MTCLACNVGFEDVDLGRMHYKTDWHRYNLKRKVVNLGPITYEKFQERVALEQKQVNMTNLNSQYKLKVPNIQLMFNLFYYQPFYMCKYHCHQLNNYCPFYQ